MLAGNIRRSLRCAARDQAVGTLLPGVEARVRTIDGIPVARGEVGELHVRGRNVMRGYYRAPDLTAKVIDSEGWFNTGDLARFDGDCLYIVGRTKEMIIRSGFNVYPAEVEAVLNSHKDVVQSAVVGRTVEGNEEVVAFVQLMQGHATNSDDLMVSSRRSSPRTSGRPRSSCSMRCRQPRPARSSSTSSRSLAA
jgi:long-chain acyl-CoA synthetase